MMTMRVVLLMTFLVGSMSNAWPVRAHEGHAHVMGTVTAVTDSQLAVQASGGQTVTIQVDRHTRYRAAGVATDGGTVRVGDRVVVEVTEEAAGVRAVEVRYVPPVTKTP
jgi:tRNA A37 threonylcarbamoyltransferase TsaD